MKFLNPIELIDRLLGMLLAAVILDGEAFSEKFPD